MPSKTRNDVEECKQGKIIRRGIALDPLEARAFDARHPRRWRRKKLTGTTPIHEFLDRALKNNLDAVS